MNPKIIFLALWMFFLVTAQAQTWQWARSLCAGKDYNPNIFVDFIESDQAGNVYVLARIPDSLVAYTTGGGTQTLATSPASPYAAVLLKYTSNGDLLWAQIISNQLVNGPASSYNKLTDMVVSGDGQVFFSGTFGFSNPFIDTLYIYGAAGTQFTYTDQYHSFDIGAGIYSGQAFGFLFRYEANGMLSGSFILDAKGDWVISSVKMATQIQAGDTLEWLTATTTWNDTLLWNGQIFDGGPVKPRGNGTLLLSLEKNFSTRWYKYGYAEGDDPWGAISAIRVNNDRLGNSYALVQARDSARFDGKIIAGEDGFIFVPLNSMLFCYNAQGQFLWSRLIDQTGYSEQFDDMDVSPQGDVYLLVQAQGQSILKAGSQTLALDPNYHLSLVRIQANGTASFALPVSLIVLPSSNPVFKLSVANDQTVYIAQQIANYQPLLVNSSDGNAVPVRNEANFSANTLISQYTEDGRLTGLLKVGHTVGNGPAALNTDAQGYLLLAGTGGGSLTPGGGMPFGLDTTGCGGGEGVFVAKLDRLHNVVEAPHPSPYISVFVCPGDTLYFPFYALDHRNPANTYTLEVSDENGSFDPPFVWGQKTSEAFFDSIAWIYPANLIASDKYRFRVVPSHALQTPSMPYTSGFSENLFSIKVPEIVADGDSLHLVFPVGADPFVLINWYAPDGQLIAQGTTNFQGQLPGNIRAIFPSQAGLYRVTYQSSCGGEVVYEHFATALDALETLWQIYPNPAQDRVVVKGLFLAEIELYDLAGRKIRLEWNRAAEGLEIQIPPHLENGVYLLRFTHEGKSYSERVGVFR
ncbi:MAG: T9SS type A sorting domain-containing protein [Bacteroidia bacterium]|nr:T9SS type A sorting domain-containing protein [Bacteroidia bacterium]